MMVPRPARAALLAAVVSGAPCACGDRPAAVDAVHNAGAAAEFAGSDSCRDCHEQQYRRWTGSHHDLAMQPATASAVLGDFDGASFPKDGINSRFFRRGEEYFVRTEGPDGGLQEFRVAYTFGVDPLQQYLVRFPDGRLQALPIAWDTRPADAGGQRWFHLYADTTVPHSDPLHWTGAQQNWNYMCAECHSTHVQRNYRIETDRFATSWSEIDVGCEGCHGPASLHVDAARRGDTPRPGGLPVDLDDGKRAAWTMNVETGIAERSVMRMRPPVQVDACGRCHSRRAPVAPAYAYGRPLLDTHLPALLDEGLYFADGQVRDEVYVWGSFLQSRMYQAGVSCTDCHDAHSTRLKAGGTAGKVCSGCHLEARFATAEHQHHPPDTVECVDCHMPSRLYMLVDGRRDHSFRVPRPDLTLLTGSPNACNACHTEQNAGWADDALRRWFGEPRQTHYAEALHAARKRQAGANGKLRAVIDDESVPGIARATALSLLAGRLAPGEVDAVLESLEAPDPLLRLGALRAAAGLPGDALLSRIPGLLGDPLMALRFEALRILSPLRDRLTPRQREDLRRVERDYMVSQLALADRAEALTNLANIARDAGDAAGAEAYYRRAIDREPYNVAARVNLADLIGSRQRHAEAQELLRQGIATGQDAAPLHHALGLSLVLSGEREAALAELGRAAALAPDEGRFAYVHAIALHSLGRPEEAVAVLEAAAGRFPADLDIGIALVTVLRDAGRRADALREARALALRSPGFAEVAALLASLEAH
ncbi:MAG: tetratricopeptide repeat protein [Woeseiaceae bacterium]